MDLHEWGALRSPEAALRSERAAQVLAALHAHGDFDLLEIRERHHEGRCEDVFHVRCRCDEVPGRNPFGIRYEEPLAIAISSDERALPEVRALRRDFPSTSHQNHVPDGEPTSLCLYDKRPAEVLRRWTAPAFLSRIQWWLSATARGELHAAGQALEQVFFESPHELILPRGFSSSEELAAPIALAGVVQRFRASDLEQKFPAITFITQRAVPRDAQPSKPPVAQLICITLPAVVHGRIEREPSTLGTLVAQMEARGAPLLGPLSEAIKSYVGQGRTTNEVSKATVLLLSIPIKESEAAPVERVQARAFWLDVDVLTLGLAIGALIRAPEQRDRVFVDHQLPGSQAEAARGLETWKTFTLSPLTDLEALPPKLDQQESGVTQ